MKSRHPPMRTSIFALLIFCSSVLGFVYLNQVAKQPDVIYQDIQHHFTQLVQDQYQDLQKFSYKLSVYTNPFSIKDKGSFTKRVYINGNLVYWNDSQPIPGYSDLKRKDSIYITASRSSLDLVQRKEMVTENDLIEIFSVLPVYSNPPVKNQYLNETFNPRIFKNFSVALSEAGEDGYEVVYEGEKLIAVTLLKASNQETEIYSFILVLLAAVSLGFLLISFLRPLFTLAIARFFFTLGIVIVVRVLLQLWTWSTMVHWDLFDPSFFTSGWLYYSLGDLLLHSVVVLFILGQVYWHMQKTGWKVEGDLQRARKVTRYLILFLAGLALSSLSVFSYKTIWILLENSQLELDISSSIQFDFLKVCAYACIVLVGLSVAVAFTLILQLVNRLSLSKGEAFIAFFCAYVVLSLLVEIQAFIYTGIFLAALVLIGSFGLAKRLSDFRYQTFVYLVVVYSAFAAVFSFAIYKHHEKEDLIAKERYGNRLLIKNDILGELFLSEIIGEIERDAYIRTRLLSRLLTRQNIREKIKTQFLSSYFKKYDINVFLFDGQGESLQQDVSTASFQDWEERYRRETYATDYPKIYFVKDDDENVRNKYVCFLNIEAFGKKVGYIILDMTLKKYIPSSVFPELLLESKYSLSSGNEYDYAVFEDGGVVYKQGRFGFENKLSSKDFKKNHLYTVGLEKRGVHYFGLKTKQGETIVIVSPTYSEQALVANFSMIFLLLLFASGLTLLFLQVYKRTSTFNLSTKIQLYLGLSFILPMLIVSIALINTLNASYKEEIDRNFQKRSYNIAENLIDITEDYLGNRINIDEFASRIAEVGAFVQSDLNVFSARGRLITSSQPEIFRLGLLSDLLDPEAYYEIKFKKEQNLIVDKAIGQLDFKASYTALRSYQDGRLLAILSMPYFDSKNHLRRQQIEVFDNLISIFTVIFLISLMVGNVIVSQLVRPLKNIAYKLRQTSLQEKNLPIHYENEDEIGSLIKEYNLMLVKLEESKEALATSQKESAWKEIARQVAHEIKNPLTPMRLKIQQMMKSFEPDEKFYKTCQVLVSQVDSLSSIADSFSEFAKMPAPNNEPIDLPRLLDEVIALYRSREVIIKKEFEVEEIMVFIDRRIFNRIFTNILLNAIQAKDTGRPVIVVSLAKTVSKVTVSIKDNGPGIPEELKDNIFTPYFSTKSKGSGIGLAVAKKGIENAGGNIWFESEQGKGTTFFISLPVYYG